MVSRLPARDAGDVDNPLDGLLGYQLRRASAVVLADFARALGELDLTPSGASVLLLVAANPSITQSDVGRTLAIQRANMAPIAAMLTMRGLVERTRSDGRSQGLRLTVAGEATASDVRRRIDRHESQVLPDLTPEERAALLTLLRRVWTR